jgi:aspartate/tyrosine/aromatic aminotransferase
MAMQMAFLADPRPDKVNLSLGVYKDSLGLPTVFESVRAAEVAIHSSFSGKEYQPIEGNAQFLKSATGLVLGAAHSDSELYTAQTIGGSGALSLLAAFIRSEISKTLILPQPSWPNHPIIFRRAGFELQEISCYDAVNHRLDFSALCSGLLQAPAGSVVLLHACCHNPTGLDPSFEQWCELSDLMKRHRLLPLFDCAYQGFGSDWDSDARALRYFYEQGHEMFIAYSFSKNLSLYGERVGMLLLTAAPGTSSAVIGTHFKELIRSRYSTPPLHGGRLAAEVFRSPSLCASWQQELSAVRNRVNEMRQQLAEGLQGSNADFAFLKQQKGLFSYSGLSPEQVKLLRDRHAIYMLSTGRINVAGLNPSNIDYVVNAIRSLL